MTKTKKTDNTLRILVDKLKKQSLEKDAGIWKRIAQDLEKPTRQRRIVNIYTLDRYTKEGEVVVVPGKVLANGIINHKVQVAAWNFSEAAKEKIQSAKGNCISINELMEKHPDGKNIRIIG